MIGGSGLPGVMTPSGLAIPSAILVQPRYHPAGGSPEDLSASQGRQAEKVTGVGEADVVEHGSDQILSVREETKFHVAT